MGQNWPNWKNSTFNYLRGEKSSRNTYIYMKKCKHALKVESKNWKKFQIYNWIIWNGFAISRAENRWKRKKRKRQKQLKKIKTNLRSDQICIELKKQVIRVHERDTIRRITWSFKQRVEKNFNHFSWDWRFWVFSAFELFATE